MFSSPALRIPYGATYAILKEAGPRGPHYGRCTEVRIDWPDNRIRLEVFRDPEQRTAAGRGGSHKAGVGFADFDRDYVVRADDENQATKLLGEGVRWQINRLRHFLGDDSVYVLISRRRMIVQKPQRLTRYPELEEFLQHALELYDQAMLTQASGIEFLESDLAQPLDGIICKVCGDGIDDGMVYCFRCKTPHHVECWQYNGACSVYGCLETKYLAPQATMPLRPHPQAKSSPSG